MDTDVYAVRITPEQATAIRLALEDRADMLKRDCGLCDAVYPGEVSSMATVRNSLAVTEALLSDVFSWNALSKSR